jgi:hypothetical protein
VLSMTSRVTIACVLSITALASAAGARSIAGARPFERLKVVPRYEQGRGFSRAVPLQPPAPTLPETPATPVVRDTDHSTVLVLLDRIDAVLDAAVKGKRPKAEAVGTSESDEAAVKVVIDRAALDEIRAEIAQIKLMLHDKP